MSKKGRLKSVTADTAGATHNGALLPGGQVVFTPVVVGDDGREVPNDSQFFPDMSSRVTINGAPIHLILQDAKRQPNFLVPAKVPVDWQVSCAMREDAGGTFVTAPGVRVLGGVVTGYQGGAPVRWKLTDGEVVDKSNAALPVIEATADGDNPAFTPTQPGDASPFPTKGDINARFDSLEAAVASGFEQLRKLFTTKG